MESIEQYERDWAFKTKDIYGIDKTIDRISYTIHPTIKQTEVVRGYKYVSSPIIPSSVTHEGVAYPVTKIGNEAFSGCDSLVSIALPNSVTSIGRYAFADCFSLTSINIPTSLTSLGECAFKGCASLTSAVIPNSVKKMNERLFDGCSSLESVVLPDSITQISNYMFRECRSLASINLGKTITSIGKYAFKNCRKLKSITLPESLSDIYDGAFSDCQGLTSITLPLQECYIQEEAFYGCDSITSLIIPEAATSASLEPFSNQYTLTDVYCYAIEVPDSYLNCYPYTYMSQVRLHVPAKSIKKYKDTYPWMYFGEIVAIEGENPEPEQCEKPTISYADGKLKFTCETEGAKFFYTLTTADVKTSDTPVAGAEVALTGCYQVNCYAMVNDIKSETATATLYWLPDAEKEDQAGIQTGTSRAVVMTVSNGIITVTGLHEGEHCEAYSVSGAKLSQAKASNGMVQLATNNESIVIVRIGSQSLKMMVK